MSDRLMNDVMCGLCPNEEGGEGTRNEWREHARFLYSENCMLRDRIRPLQKEIGEINTGRHSAMEDIILEAKNAYEDWVYDDDTAGDKIQEIMGHMIERYKWYRRENETE